MTNEQRVALWDAINRYVTTCGGDPSKHVYGNTRRMDAVVDVENAFRAIEASSQAEVTALRRSIIHLHDIMDGRHRDAVAAWAIRQAANKLSVPFSDDAVQAKYLELTEGEPKPPEIRRREDGSFDEIVARDCFVHFEMMDDNFLWVGITTKDGKTLSVDVLAEIPKRRKRPVIRVVTRDESTLPTAADSAEVKQS